MPDLQTIAENLATKPKEFGFCYLQEDMEKVVMT
jgi:hypothetical protein